MPHGPKKNPLKVYTTDLSKSIRKAMRKIINEIKENGSYEYSPPLVQFLENPFEIAIEILLDDLRIKRKDEGIYVGISRQRKYQILHESNGLCSKCNKMKDPESKLYCKEHLEYSRSHRHLY